MGKERQKRKQEEIKNKILDVAREIISKEGIQGLSIRKITNQLEYSPASVYHYFKNKNELVETLVSDGYRQILASIASVEQNPDDPEKEIRAAFRNYIQAALASPEVYKAFMLNQDSNVLNKTALLSPGVAKTSRTLQTLCNSIQQGINQGKFNTCNIELTSQVIWTSVFGLIIKLIIEKEVSTDQINRLIDQLFDVLFKGITVRN